ncbi:MAG: sugar ABC transporter ATP-binding protein [Firmicutes bacterium]|nr:sugar ABC transporter ATP-binding protein [Bacillota bacterium]
MEQGNILETVKICKRYPGVQALDEVDFELKCGEVHALVGQNGAGKSTLVEIIAGTVKPDSGKIIISGKAFNYLEPSKSIELGIQTVHQENQLVEELSVADNIFLHDLPSNKFGFVNESASVNAATNLLKELNIAISPDRKLSDLTFIERKLVSLAKATSRNAQILILDEPTASLDEKGKNILFKLIRKYTEKGRSVIYISHHLGEIFEICDRVTVLKDGRKVGTHQVKKIRMNDIIHQMIGQSTTSLYNRKRSEAPGGKGEHLEVIDYHRQGVVDHISFTVQKGEIFGIGGLVGSGRTELARMIFGLDKKDSGRLVYCGKDITPKNPSDAIQKGIGFLTEDRKSTGLIMKRPIFENISLVQLAKSSSFFLNLIKEYVETNVISQKLMVKTPSNSQLVGNLSGGNQQKVVLAKWLFAGSNILIIDEPTAGIDVGAKSEIYKLMDELADKGKIIIMISSDNPELVSICDRVGVMRDGRLVKILTGEEITEENILHYSMGVDEKGGLP